MPVADRSPRSVTQDSAGNFLEISAKLSKEALSGMTAIRAMALRNKYYGFFGISAISVMVFRNKGSAQ